MALREDKIWSEGVYVELGELGNYMVVTSTRQALNILEDRLPVRDGQRYKSAVKLCGTVLKGKAPPDRAREMFVEAADEAEVYSGPVPKQMLLVLPAPGARKVGMRFYPKKPTWK
ncbi:DUF982 domain-containing protein [Rhizobium sp. VS19-DR104.2]|nr:MULTISPECIES: DUF982 domain-containing protein [unclassified Rhizobium]MBZ5757971.1 DUF982 domain-containing protein [Rhizobium sp. VS19-DR96]MBZ5772742.1 DUF982 domain-containing protein [Rhizobium sp. VS19-DRK62.2]MBZ5816703.1 DUF982 domain-containing protein [Rhizobium sp. VS19-DR183]MBZ5829051.1 DUF982 domain-containing protein [Rhizobium sp. VS19-DR104.2]